MSGKEDGRGAKQVILIRTDIMNREQDLGKVAAQAAHASCASAFSNDIKKNLPTGPDENGTYHYSFSNQSEAFNFWITNRFVKICLAVNSEEELLAIYEKAKQANLPVSLIQDAGFTLFKGTPTYTTVGIGPAWDDEFVGITDHLKIYKGPSR